MKNLICIDCICLFRLISITPIETLCIDWYMNNVKNIKKFLLFIVINNKNLRLDSGLIEIPTKGLYFTWINNNKDNDQVWERLDRAFDNTKCFHNGDFL